MADLLYSNKVNLRFDGETGHCFAWTPYSEAFVTDLKQTFNSTEAMGDAYGMDPGAEWDQILGAWKIHTGWIGCEDWTTKLVTLLNKHYPMRDKYDFNAT